MRMFCVLILLGMFVAPAMADTDLPTAIEGMRNAIEARLDQIGDPADKVLKKEAKLLGKALGSLDKFIEADKKGLKASAKAAKLAEKAGSVEASVVNAVQTMIDSMKQLSDQYLEDVEDQLSELKTDKTIEKMAKVIAKWRALAESIGGAGFGTAAKILAKSIGGLDKTGGKLAKAIEKEIKKGGGGGTLTVTDGKINVPAGETLLITNILYNFKVTVNGVSTNVKGDVKSDGGTQFPIEWPGGGLPFDGNQFIPFPPSLLGLPIKIKGSFTYKTNFGDLKVSLNLN